MVRIKSLSSIKRRESGRDRCEAMSIPASAQATIEVSLAGKPAMAPVPAEETMVAFRAFSDKEFLRRPSPMGLRQMLPVQTTTI